MVAIHETAYPRLRSRTSFKDLDGSIWEPTTQEIEWIQQQAKKPLHRQVLLIMLKMFQYLGYHMAVDDIPTGFIQYYKRKVNSRNKVAEVRQHANSSVRIRYINKLREYLKVTSYDRGQVICWAQEAACTKHHVVDIINEVLERLIKEHCEIPGFSILEKIALDSRSKANKKLYSLFSSSLCESSKKVLASFLSEEAWKRLKREPGKLSTKNSKETLAQLEWLKNEASKLPPLPEMTPEKLEALKLEACALDHAEMARLKLEKQALLLALLLRYRLSKTLDDAADIYRKVLRKMHNKGNERLKKWLNEQRKQQEKLIDQLKEVTLAYQEKNDNAEHKLEKIGLAFKRDPQKIIESCNQFLNYSDNNYLPFILTLYHRHRPTLFEALNLINLKTPSHNSDLINAIRFIKKHRRSNKSHLDFSDKPISLDWVPARRWWSLVTGTKKKGDTVKTIHRHYLELCAFTQVAEALNACDLFIEHSDQYGDYRQQFISKKQYQEEYVDYCKTMGFPSEPTAFCQHIKGFLYDACKRTDEQFPENTEVRIEDKLLVISPVREEEKPSGLEDIVDRLQQKMPTTNILDVLTETEQWLKLSQHVRPLSGHSARITNIDERFVLNLLCYGCNLGPSQVAQSVQNISRKQISRINLKYTSEENLSRCIRDTVNAYNRFVLPNFWGTGKSVSADGTRYDVYENNLLSEYHIRYGSWGGIGYYHVSDKYIALFSRFIPCGVYEAIYILDALLENDSDIQPDTIHSDTHGQSYVVFGLAYLLGIKLMPRIKNIKRLNFFRPEAGVKFDHINDLFSKSIRSSIIEKNLPEMLRAAMSIRAGTLSASTLARRLKKKNQLYYGFRELGKLVRTQFLMEYIGDGGLRRIINASTNKSEAFNKFSDWLFFGNKGVIRENERHEQSKILKWNHLVSNMVIFHNVEAMGRTLKELKHEGCEITEEILGHLSPYLQSANLLGDYRLDTSKQVRSLDFSIQPL